MSGGWVYILTNRAHGTLYIGVTADLARRMAEHRGGTQDSFPRRYGLTLLVFAEWHDDIRTAIQRETSLKRWPRAWKERLIMDSNHFWQDLTDQLA